MNNDDFWTTQVNRQLFSQSTCSNFTFKHTQYKYIYQTPPIIKQDREKKKNISAKHYLLK